jgi:hypothetical protein
MGEKEALILQAEMERIADPFVDYSMTKDQ